MAMDKNSNGFTFGFAIVMVIVVGVALAFSYQFLKPPYEENVRKEKMQNILASINIIVERSEAPERFKAVLKDQFIIDMNGSLLDTDEDAFDLDIPQQYKEWKAKGIDDADMKYPVFLCELMVNCIS